MDGVPYLKEQALELIQSITPHTLELLSAIGGRILPAGCDCRSQCSQLGEADDYFSCSGQHCEL